MDSYVVRIYRYEKDKPHKLVGTVEHVGTDGKKAFTHVEELWEILNPPKREDDIQIRKNRREKAWNHRNILKNRGKII